MSYTGQPKLWVLIADGGRARVVTPEAYHGRFHTVLELGNAAHPDFAGSDRGDRKKPEEAAFAETLAARLNEEARIGAYERLVLVAPGHILHAVRNGLDKQATALLAGTLPKDLTKVPDHELTEHLKDWWMGSNAAPDATFA
jgi:hypothetical protein